MLQNSSHAFGSEAEKQQVIKKVFKLSCHSTMLAKLYPNISAATHMVPEFIHAEACVGDCRVCNFFTSHYKRDWLRKTYVIIIKYVCFPGARKQDRTHKQTVTI